MKGKVERSSTTTMSSYLGQVHKTGWRAKEWLISQHLSPFFELGMTQTKKSCQFKVEYVISFVAVSSPCYRSLENAA